MLSYPSPDPLEGGNTMEFFGQRPWRPGKISSEPPDPQIERNGIQALQFLEKAVNHSVILYVFDQIKQELIIVFSRI